MQKSLADRAVDVLKRKPLRVRRVIVERLAEGRFRVVASVDRRPDGRVDTRSVAYTLLVDYGERGWTPLCRVLLRRHVLVDHAPDNQTEAHELDGPRPGDQVCPLAQS